LSQDTDETFEEIMRSKVTTGQIVGKNLPDVLGPAAEIDPRDLV
jgi:hypothetical protein